MYNYIIIEEEKLGISLIKTYFNQLRDFHFCGHYNNPYEALVTIKTSNIKIVFISYSESNVALEFIKSINREILPVFIVMSSNPQLIFKTIRIINVIDFIIKPVVHNHLNDTLKIIKHAIKLRTNKLEGDTHKDFIFIKVDKKNIRIKIDSIEYLESVKDYVRVVTSKKRYLVYKTLTNFTKELDKIKFMRVHRSYTVSVQKITAVGLMYLEIANKKIPFSRKIKEELRNRLYISK